MTIETKNVTTLTELKTLDASLGGMAAVLYDISSGVAYGLGVEVLIGMDASIQKADTSIAGFETRLDGHDASIGLLLLADSSIGTRLNNHDASLAGLSLADSSLYAADAVIISDEAAVVPMIPYRKRVNADSGSILDYSLLVKWFGEWLRTKASFDRAYIFELGIKERTSGANKFASKFYDLMTGNYDGVQLTEATQPYTTVNAAPNSRKGLRFVQGQTQTGATVFTTKTYAAADPRTIAIAIKLNKKGSTRLYLSAASYIEFTATTVVINNGSANIITGTYNFECGKIYIIEFQYENGLGLVKVNGIVVQSSFFLSAAGLAIGQITYNSSYPFDGTLYAFLLANSRLSEYDSTTIYTVLRAMFPEIEGIGMGNQWWATENFAGTVAGDGTTVQEVQGDTTGSELITVAADRDLSSDTGWWTKNGPTTIDTGSARIYNVAGALSSLTRSGFLTIGKQYLLSYEVISNDAGLLKTASGFGDSVAGVIDSTVGVKNVYFKALSTSLEFVRNSTVTDIRIDNISLKECGAADSTLVYNNIYALTTGTATVKDIAATKAAAMWAHYNNDPALGAIYGKLYNWYAVHLFDLYPPCRGWRVPSSADMGQLQTYLGGSTVFGGRLKKDGTTYWGAPNSGATNESGFSALPGGLRASADGSFDKITTDIYCYCSDGYRLNLSKSLASGTIILANAIYGFSLRLLRNQPNTPETFEKTTGYVTNNISVTPLDITSQPMGNSVMFLRVLSDTAMTGFQAVLYTGAGVAKETLCTGVAITANQPAYIPISVSQSLQLTDFTVRVSATTKTDTAGRFMVNIGLESAYKNQL